MASTSMPAAATPLAAAGTLTDPNERFLREQHPEILAARSEPHAFVPFASATDLHHVCRPTCVCAFCWEPKGNRKMHPKGLA